MKSIKLYGIPNCNTVKKAMDFLKANDISFEFHDFKKKGADSELLRSWMDRFGWEKVINKQGLTFKKLSPEEKLSIQDENSAISYLTVQTSAIKRPILELDGHAVILGFDEQSYNSLLK